MARDDTGRKLSPEDYMAFWHARREDERAARLARRDRRTRFIERAFIAGVAVATILYLGVHVIVALFT